MRFDDDDTGDLKSDVGRRLRKLRTILGVDQVEIAKVAGLKQSGYTRCETGERLMKPQHAIRICDRYHLTLDWIYRGDTMGLTRKMIQDLVILRAKALNANTSRKTPPANASH